MSDQPDRCIGSAPSLCLDMLTSLERYGLEGIPSKKRERLPPKMSISAGPVP